MNIDYKQKAIEIHKMNVAKGFYDKVRSPLERKILIKSEVFEALEAYLDNRFANKDALYTQGIGFLSFENTIKDTFEDELADIWIRSMDSYGYYLLNGYGLEDICYNENNIGFTEHVYINYIFNPFRFVSLIGQRIERFNLIQVIKGIKDICNRSNIDLEKHIELKLKYNESRPRKHGKRI